MFKKIACWIISRGMLRPHDFCVGGELDPYLLRWFLIPRNPFFNIYLHCFLRSDDDRALHDHPWFNLSILLRGQYVEETIRAGGVHRYVMRQAGCIKFRTPWHAHRIELIPHPDYESAMGAIGYEECWTLFITGPKLRSWGFHCPNGWRGWKRFTAPGDSGKIGKGCDD